MSRQTYDSGCNEFWMKYRKRPLRFSLLEYCLLLRLNCSKFYHVILQEDEFRWRHFGGRDSSLGDVIVRMNEYENDLGDEIDLEKLKLASLLFVAGVLGMKVVDYEKHGGPDVLRIKERPKPTVKIYEIMIQVEAIGLNVCDTWLRQGAPFHQYGFREGIGCECSGKVTVVGSDTCEFKEGDEVCASLHFGGAYAEFVVVHERDVLRIPSGVSLVQAAALPEASRLTIFALSVLKNVTIGNTILIHDTAGGTDFIAIQYVKHIGCKVFAVAGTKKKLRICQRLGADVCINYRKEDVCKRVKDETGEKGVDIILDVSGRDHFQKNMDCPAKGGSLVISGHEIGSPMDIDLSFLMKKGISIIGADVRTINLFERRQLLSDVAATLWPLIEDGHIKPIIGKIFSFDEAAEAHRALEEGCIPGKLLLVPEKNDVM